MKKENTEKLEKTTSEKVWENMQLLFLGMTIAGQITVGACFLLGQGIWLVANIGALIRDFMLHRPVADKVKNAALTGITTGLILASFIL